MTEYVRVRDNETGHHVSIARERFEGAKDLFTELKQDATNSAGDPLPPKHKTSVASASEKQAESPATEKGK